ncbi:MAG: NfeD family protein [Hespellia sp.]|nr:NfeD family protein [Hespellia sp.]
MNGLSWIVLFIVLIIIEIFTMGLTTIWFAGGSLVAFVLSLLGLSLPIQVIAFVVVSVALFLVTRPIAMKYFNKDRVKTNVESLLGKTALVTENIDNIHATGKVEVNGLEWTARAEEDGLVIEKNSVVEILKIQGVKLIVKKEEAK